MYNIVDGRADHLSSIPAIEQAAATLFSEDDLPLTLRYKITDPSAVKLAQEQGRLIVAEQEGGGAVGFAITTEADGFLHLDEMDVLPSHSRQGIGTQLVNAVIDRCANSAYDCLSLITFRHLPWNAPFYVRFGFVEASPEQIGSQLKLLLEEERDAGIDISKRIVMLRNLANEPG
jgi:GNAT superfamily N-acetyltransferase